MNLEKQLPILTVTVEGLETTKSDFLIPFIEKLYPLQTVEQVITKCAEICSTWEKWDIFDSIQVEMDLKKDKNERPVGIDVFFKIKEKKMRKFQ